MPDATASDLPARRPDPARTRADILSAARRQFVAHGLNGARVDAIAEATRTTKRMIYYYFGSKEGLYAAVLEDAYAQIRAAEAELRLADLAPEPALRRLIEFTFDYEDAHPDFVRLIAVENIHHAAHLNRMDSIRAVNAGVIDTLAGILARGHADGVFRTDVQPLDVHLMISALCFYRVSNRHTFGAIFNCDLAASPLRARHRRMIVQTIIGWVKRRPEGDGPA